MTKVHNCKTKGYVSFVFASIHSIRDFNMILNSRVLSFDKVNHNRK